MSKPGNSGAGRRCPVASSQSDDGPGRMRMPCAAQTGSQLRDALGVVPHPVAVDQPGAGLLGDAEHPPVDVRGNARQQGRRRRAQRCRPLGAHEVVVAADAAARDDDGRGAQLEVADDLAGARRAASAPRRRQHGSAHADHGPALDDQVVDSVPVQRGDESGLHAGADPVDERLEDAGPGAPDDVEPGHRVAVPDRGVAAALGPADDGEEAHALPAQPGPLLAGGEVEVGLGPRLRPAGPRRGRIRRCRTSPAGPARGSP